MAAQGVGTYKLNSFWESGRLIFYEKAYGHTTTGNVFILGHDYVQVGDTANDVDLKWLGTTTGTFTLDALAHTLAMTGVATSTDGAVTITNATATSSATTGALIVTGGVGVTGAVWAASTSRLVGAITADATMGIAGLVTSTSVTGFRSNPTFVPDSTYTNYAFSVGNKVAGLTVNFANAAAQNFNPIQAIVNCTATGTGPTNSSQTNLFFAQLTHNTNAMANLRLKCADFTTIIGKNVLDAYAYQGEVDFTTGVVTVGGEAAVMGLVMNAGSYAVTGNLRGLIISMQGSGSYSTVVGLEIRTTCGDVLGHGCSEAIRIAGTPLPVVGIAMGNQTNDNEGPQNAFFFPSIGGADEGPCVASGTATGAVTIKIGTATRYIRFWETA